MNRKASLVINKILEGENVRKALVAEAKSVLDEFFNDELKLRRSQSCDPSEWVGIHYVRKGESVDVDSTFGTLVDDLKKLHLINSPDDITDFIFVSKLPDHEYYKFYVNHDYVFDILV